MPYTQYKTSTTAMSFATGDPDWVDKKLRLLGHLFHNDMNNLKNKVYAMDSKIHAMDSKILAANAEIRAVHNAIRIVGNENLGLKKEVEKLSQNPVKRLEPPCPEQEKPLQLETSQPNRSDHNSHPQRSHCMTLRSHDRNVAQRDQRNRYA